MAGPPPMRGRRTLQVSGSSPAVERRLAQPAVGTVADVQADQLFAARADPQVLWHSQQRGIGGGEWKRPGDGPHLLAGLAIHVRGAGLDWSQRLAARDGRTQPVDLPPVHARKHDIRWSDGPPTSLGAIGVLIFHGYLLRG